MLSLEFMCFGSISLSSVRISVWLVSPPVGSLSYFDHLS